MKRILVVIVALCLISFWYVPLTGQETWTVQHIVDNDDVIFSVNQSSATGPRDNRGLALSHDGDFLYLSYNNPSGSRLVRKIDLSVTDPAKNHDSVVKQLKYTSGEPAKSIATDDKGRVYLLYGPPDDILYYPIYDSTLSAFTIVRSLEIWIYNRPSTAIETPNMFSKIFPYHAKFVFGDLTGDGLEEQIYSTVEGEMIDPRVYRDFY